MIIKGKQEIGRLSGQQSINFDVLKRTGTGRCILQQGRCSVTGRTRTFVAGKIYKELERQHCIKNYSSLSAEKVIDILKTIYEISITIPYSNTKHTRLLVKNEDQKMIINLFDLKILI